MLKAFWHRLEGPLDSLPTRFLRNLSKVPRNAVREKRTGKEDWVDWTNRQHRDGQDGDETSTFSGRISRGTRQLRFLCESRPTPAEDGTFGVSARFAFQKCISHIFASERKELSAFRLVSRFRVSNPSAPVVPRAQLLRELPPRGRQAGPRLSQAQSVRVGPLRNHPARAGRLVIRLMRARLTGARLTGARPVGVRLIRIRRWPQAVQLQKSQTEVWYAFLGPRAIGSSAGRSSQLEYIDFVTCPPRSIHAIDLQAVGQAAVSSPDAMSRSRM